MIRGVVSCGLSPLCMLGGCVADPGCFIPDPTIFSSRIPDPDPNIFHPGSYMTSGKLLFSLLLMLSGAKA
jgi:hypothetical protein